MSKIERLNDVIREELAIAVNREVGIKDALVTITYVECSPDLKQAKVGFSVLPDKLAGTALRRLGSATSQLAGILRTRTRMRKLPHLIWEFDATEREAGKIERLIADINEEDRGK